LTRQLENAAKYDCQKGCEGERADLYSPKAAPILRPEGNGVKRDIEPSMTDLQASVNVPVPLHSPLVVQWCTMSELKPARLRKFALVFLFFALSTTGISADDHPARSYGRSMVVTQYGIVATSYLQASQAGARILEQGGSAIDAGIAANAMLGVAEPMMNGIGGDLFAIYRDAKTGKLYGLNASGWAPRGLTIEHLRAKGITTMPQAGIDSVTVPGAVDGWAKLHGRFGKLPWEQLFEPAIAYARTGYGVPEIIHGYWEHTVPWLAADAESQRVYLPNGKAPEIGQIFRNPELADTLTMIAKQGRDAFYKGPIAQAILKTSNELGGTMTADDLSEFSAEWVTPLGTTYRDWKVYELPPNGDGIAALEMLNIMEQSQPSTAGPLSAAELHTRIEAMKLAYADVKAYDGDPRFGAIPLETLLSKDFAAKRAKLINRLVRIVQSRRARSGAATRPIFR
jgi:gamma-glutamyltranspeptidase/glutathione hydrolase